MILMIGERFSPISLKLKDFSMPSEGILTDAEKGVVKK